MANAWVFRLELNYKKPDLAKFSQGIKLYRKLRYRKGYGVHSPFVYNLITKVIEEKKPYYVFDDIEKLRDDLLIGRIQKAYPSRLGRLLFRLVNYFKCKSVLHVGSGSGMLIPYLLTPFADCKGVVLGQGEELILTTEKMKERLGLKNVEFYSDDYMDILNGFIAQSFKFDIIFIDLMDPDITVELIWMCLKCIHGHTILVIRGIRRNKKMKMMWKRLRENSICVISLDLYTLGIVFFDNKMYKRHYKMHF